MTAELRAKIVALYDEILSVRETGRRLGVHENSVRQVLKASRGLCADCVNPILLGQRYCAGCAARRAANMQAKRKARRRAGICLECDERIQPPSQQYCDTHRLGHAASSRKHVSKTSRHVTGHGLPADWQRLKQIRYNYGEAGIEAWERDRKQCVLCSVHYKDKTIHIHHIDGDDTHHVAENLVCLCLRCHRLVHLLSQHPNPHTVVQWFTAHYPDHLIAQLIRRGSRQPHKKRVVPEQPSLDFVGS
jgi:5-methylcytosine-specific restriction endonuclease McrA